MEKLSVVLLTRGEKGIERCLGSIDWVDEIVVVDTGAPEERLAVIRGYTGAVCRGDMGQGFAYNRNLGNEHARNNWILKVDTDEVVSAELREEIQAVLRDPGRADGYYAATRALFHGHWIRGCGWYPMTQIRLFDKRKAEWVGRIHERLAFRGTAGHLRHDILHYSYDDIQHYFQKFNLYTSFEAQKLKDQGKRITWSNLPASFLLRPAGFFLKSYVLQKGWKDGFYGFLVSLYSSLYVLVKYMKLYEAQGDAEANVPARLVRD